MHLPYFHTLPCIPTHITNTHHTLSDNGTVYTGGDNSYGQLGSGTNNKYNSIGVVTVANTPHKVLFVDVATGAWHTVLLSGVF